MEPIPSSKQDILANDTLNCSPSSNQFGSSCLTPSQPSVHCPTLTSFLNQLDISQYHNLFIDAGIREDDIEKLIYFDETELKDVLSSIPMKSFHSIIFKKGIRELRQTFSSNPPMLPSDHMNPFLTPISQIDSLNSSHKFINITPAKVLNKPKKPKKSKKVNSTPTPVSNDEITRCAIIYGRNSSRQLTKYEQAINNAAIGLALQDPTLLKNRGDLFKNAKIRLLDEGYDYKNGISRSKLNTYIDPKTSIAVKRLDAYAAEKIIARISELERKLKVKEMQYESAMEPIKVKLTQNNSEDLKAQVSLEEFEKERRQIKRELARLRNKQCKHRWYEQTNKETESKVDEVEEFPNDNDNNEHSGKKEPSI
ncbi:hypothetical protein C1645_744974 [Glomus cerebriforme]|uniref:NAB co-repressor domain-containing protein n=1 Tax=Glomus cerebriforme TaxID=658196 RepID=A0A397S939_9GLOM|nr:hypothetical protein C1645_744974 [Glomus cerebriforme]